VIFPPIIKQLIDVKLLSSEDALSFCTYNLWQEQCSCGAVIVPDESLPGQWFDLQGFRQNGRHTHAPAIKVEDEIQVATHGFSFSPDLARVVLITNHTKNPQLLWHDKMMGLGGKLEGTESPLDCMVREFREESGVQTRPEDWSRYCLLAGTNQSRSGAIKFRVYCYYHVGDAYKLVRSAEPDKHVKAYLVANLYGGLRSLMYSNAQWLLTMALTLATGQEKRALGYEVTEV
jgi:8-oxo-dGTP diphosphatase